MNDKRKNWEYRGCEIVPINCQHPTWGKCGEAIRFGDRYLRLYWRIDFTDGTWVHTENKQASREYIDNRKG